MLTVNEAAILGVCEDTLEDWRQQGRVRYIRLGYRTIRFRREWIEELLRAAEV